jgi:hypothetical protein
MTLGLMEVLVTLDHMKGSGQRSIAKGVPSTRSYRWLHISKLPIGVQS